MSLTLFFTVLGFLKRTIGGTSVLPGAGFVRSGKLVRVHLRDGHVTPKIRFIGFGDSNTKNAAIPHQLSSMMVFETEAGARLMIRADSIKIVEEIAETV
jgi:hypothetical protein